MVELADGDRIVRFVEKPAPGEAPSSWANAGTWIFEPEVLEHIPDEKMDGSLERLVFPSLIADGFASRASPRTPTGWTWAPRSATCSCTPTSWRGASTTGCPRAAPSKRSPARTARSGTTPSSAPASCSGRNCRIGGLVNIVGPTVIGDSCDVRDKARIERSIIWGGSKIGSGAIVRDSIIGSDVWIGDDAVIEGAVIANGARVRRGAHLPRGARLEPDEVAG